jgi:threonyl-tRNA synthetase
MCIVGKKEEENGTVTLREHTVGDLGSMSLEAALEKLGLGS